MRALAFFKRPIAVVGLAISMALIAGCTDTDIVKSSQKNGDLENLECIVTKAGKQHAVYVDIRNNTWVASKLYDTSLFQYGGKPKTGEVELANAAPLSQENVTFYRGGADSVVQMEKAGLPADRIKSEEQSVRDGLKSRAEQEFCFDVIIGQEGMPVCRYGLNPRSMSYFSYAVTELPNGRYNLSWYSPSNRPEELRQRDILGICRKQSEVLLR